MFITRGLLFLLTLSVASAQSRVRIAVGDATPASPDIPADFAGLSFEMKDVLPDAAGHHLFRPDNRALLATFRTLGVTSLRIGGNTTDTPSVPEPSDEDLDLAFGFVRESGLKTLFTLRLRKGDPEVATRVAQYIWAHYQPELIAFAIGNEPNVYDKTFPVYLADLHRYMAAITAPDVAPGARFAAPGTTGAHPEWVRQVAADFQHDPRLVLITEHEYPGGNGRKAGDPSAARDKLLSPRMLATYQRTYDNLCPAIAAAGKHLRLEETNSYYDGGAKDVSDSMAGALWALDYLHWWAAHGAVGLNFHTGDHVAAADELTPCRYAAFWTSPRGYEIHPVGYALKTFALGGTGLSLPVQVSGNADRLDLTAYAVRRADGSLSVTLINKEHGLRGLSAEVLLRLPAAFAQAQSLALESPAHDAAATSGLTLGGAAVADDASWMGTWSDVAAPDNHGEYTLEVPPATAVVLRFMTQNPAGQGEAEH